MILVSVFRNSQDYLDRYFDQTDELARSMHEPLRRVCVEGDSTDQTWKVLANRLGPNDVLLKCEHGGPTFESQDIPQRWRQIALACNVAMTAAIRINTEEQAVVYMESDLMWDTPTIHKLVDHLSMYPAVAPMSMQRGRFYDIWGYVKDGIRFGPYPPYHPGINPGRMVTIDSAGSCTAMTAQAARVVEFSLTDCIRGVGRSLYANGFSLWLDPTLKVVHPS